MKLNILNLVLMVIISIITNISINSLTKSEVIQPNEPDSAYIDLQNKLNLNDAEIQLLQQSIDSLTSIQTSTNEKLKTIRAGRNRNNPVISSLSSAELTQLLTKRYADSLAGHAGAAQ